MLESNPKFAVGDQVYTYRYLDDPSSLSVKGKIYEILRFKDPLDQYRYIIAIPDDKIVAEYCFVVRSEEDIYSVDCKDALLCKADMEQLYSILGITSKLS